MHDAPFRCLDGCARTAGVPHSCPCLAAACIPGAPAKRRKQQSACQCPQVSVRLGPRCCCLSCVDWTAWCTRALLFVQRAPDFGSCARRFAGRPWQFCGVGLGAEYLTASCGALCLGCWRHDFVSRQGRSRAARTRQVVAGNFGLHKFSGPVLAGDIIGWSCGSRVCLLVWVCSGSFGRGPCFVLVE